MKRPVTPASQSVGAFALEPLGFLPASVAAQAALLLIAQHERWTLARLLAYALSTGLVLVFLYLLFKQVLKVPLP